MTDEELGALLLQKARAESRIVKLNAEIKNAATALLKLADTVSNAPNDVEFKNLPGEVGQWPARAGRFTEFEWSQVDTSIVAKRLIDLRAAQTEIEEAERRIRESGGL